MCVVVRKFQRLLECGDVRAATAGVGSDAVIRRARRSGKRAGEQTRREARRQPAGKHIGTAPWEPSVAFRLQPPRGRSSSISKRLPPHTFAARELTGFVLSAFPPPPGGVPPLLLCAKRRSERLARRRLP